MGDYKVQTLATEMQVREWFAAHLGEFGYSIVQSGSAFPDWMLEDESGHEVRAEVELESGNFVQHGHDPAGCDLVICWQHTVNLPVPVLELATRIMHEGRQGAHDKPPRVPIKPVAISAKCLDKCRTELDDFTRAMVDDLQAESEWEQFMREPRLKLLSAQARLQEAIYKHGGASVLNAWGNLHPHDLYKRLRLTVHE